METIIIHPRNQKELSTIEAILKALDVPFHRQEEGPYDREITGKGDQGKSTSSLADDVWKLE